MHFWFKNYIVIHVQVRQGHLLFLAHPPNDHEAPQHDFCLTIRQPSLLVLRDDLAEASGKVGIFAVSPIYQLRKVNFSHFVMFSQTRTSIVPTLLFR